MCAVGLWFGLFSFFFLCVCVRRQRKRIVRAPPYAQNNSLSLCAIGRFFSTNPELAIAFSLVCKELSLNEMNRFPGNLVNRDAHFVRM